MKIPAVLFPLGLLLALALGCDDEPEVIDLCKDRELQSVGPYEICTDDSQCAAPFKCLANVCMQTCPGKTDAECDLAPLGFCDSEQRCSYFCDDYSAKALAESECWENQVSGFLTPRLCQTCGPAYCPWHE